MINEQTIEQQLIEYHDRLGELFNEVHQHLEENPDNEFREAQFGVIANVMCWLRDTFPKVEFHSNRSPD